MFQRQSFWSQDVYVPTNHISSWSASSRGAIFTNRTDIEHRKVSDISNKDPKANNFQSRGAKHSTAINLSNNNNSNKSGNSLEVRKQTVCTYKDTICIIMRNVKVMLVFTSIYWIVRQQLRDKLQAITGERKHINTEEVNKQKQRWREIHKEYINEKLRNAEP
jgi:hypothetical protein